MHKFASRTLLLLLVALTAWVRLGWTANTFLAQDGCLDRGGAWDRDRRVCDGARR